MQLGAKIHPVAENRRKIRCIVKIPQSHTAERARCKIREHVHIAPLRVEIAAQNRPEKRQPTNAALPAELRDPRGIELYWQLGCAHRQRA